MLTNRATEIFAYLFDEALAKVGLAALADPTTTGLLIFGKFSMVG